MAAGRFEDPEELISEPATEAEEDVVISVRPLSDPLPLEPVTPMATDEYEGDPLTTRVTLLPEACLGSSAGPSGNSWRLAGVGGLITAEPEVPLVFAVPPDVFLADACAAWVRADFVLGPGN